MIVIPHWQLSMSSQTFYIDWWTDRNTTCLRGHTLGHVYMWTGCSPNLNARSVWHPPPISISLDWVSLPADMSIFGVHSCPITSTNGKTSCYNCNVFEQCGIINEVWVRVSFVFEFVQKIWIKLTRPTNSNTVNSNSNLTDYYCRLSTSVTIQKTEFAICLNK